MAFHDVFAFGRPFSVPLESEAIRGPVFALQDKSEDIELTMHDWPPGSFYLSLRR
jgi:hypothetical protein